MESKKPQSVSKKWILLRRPDGKPIMPKTLADKARSMPSVPEFS